MGRDAFHDYGDEHSKDVQLHHLRAYGIDTSKIDNAVEKMVEEYERDRRTDNYDDSESEAMVKELWKEGGFMDQMIDDVILKCHELGYKFEEDP